MVEIDDLSTGSNLAANEVCDALSVSNRNMNLFDSFYHTHCKL